jgi:hypothetical protein
MRQLLTSKIAANQTFMVRQAGFIWATFAIPFVTCETQTVNNKGQLELPLHSCHGNCDDAPDCEIVTAQNCA